MEFRFRIVVIAVLSCMLVAVAVSSSTSSNPDTVVSVVFGHVSTLDPAYARDSSSKAILLIVYEGLIRTSVENCDATSYRYPEEFWACSPTRFEPVLATCVPTKENGNISFNEDGTVSYYFPIRDDVYFHNGDKLTPEDVEYTYERALIEGDVWGESWMLMEALFGQSSLNDLALAYKITKHPIDELIEAADKGSEEAREDLREVCRTIQSAIEVERSVVVFHLYRPRADFLAILAQDGPAFNHIIDKNWAIQQGDWPGTCDGWWRWYGLKPSQSPLHNKVNGTGPYKVLMWDPGQEITLHANDSYRRGKPKIKQFTRWEIDCPATRTQMILAGNADVANVPIDMLPQFRGRDEFKVLDKLPIMAMNPVIFFNTDVKDEGNDLIGSGRLDGNGILPKFFADIHVRKAFAYAFDYEGYIDNVFINDMADVVKKRYCNGRCHAEIGPIPRALPPYYDEDLQPYYFDIDKAIEELKEAWNGDLWRTGFKFTIPYVKENKYQKAIAEVLQSIQELNDKFHIDLKEVSWGEYLDYLNQRKMPLFVLGWIADYPDPDNFIRPFMHSWGYFMNFQGEPLIQLAKKVFDPLIKEAREAQDESERQRIYYELQGLAQECAIQIYLPQETAVRVVRTNLHNLPWNPLLVELLIYQHTYKEP